MRIDLTSTRNAALLVFTACLAVYGNSLWNGFAYDDTWIIANNARVHQLTDMRAIWLTPYWPTFGEALGLYRPLTVFLFAIQWAIADGAAWVFHGVNVLLHGAASVLVLLLLRRLTTPAGALAGALIFAVHPVHTEAVANVVGQAEVLAAIGVLGACLLFADREGVGISRRRTAVLAGLLTLALLSKEGAIVLPFMVVLVDLALGRTSLQPRAIAAYCRKIGRLIAAFGVVVAAYLLVRMQVLGNIAGSDVAPSYPFLYGTKRVLNAFRAWPEYVRLLFFPSDLSADYSPAVILPVESLSPLVVLGALLLLATIAIGLMVAQKPAAGFGAGWIFLTILPISNLLYTIGVVLAERTLYLPSVGVSAFVAYGWMELEKREPRLVPRAWLALSAVILVFAFRTVVRNPEWKTTATIMDSIMRDHPESYRAQWTAAARAFARGDTAQAEEHWAFAYGLYRNDSQMLTELGAFNLQMKRYGAAEAVLQDAHARHPNVTRTLQFLAVAHMNAGHFHEALGAVDRSIRLLGPSSYLFDMRARSLMGLGRMEEAGHAWRAAIRHPGGDAWMQWSMLGRSLAAAGHKGEAAAAFDTAATRGNGNAAIQAEVVRMREKALAP